MIKIIDNKIMREGLKLGWIDGDHIFDRTGKKIAYFDSAYAYDMTGKRIVHVEGEYAFYSRDNTKVRLEDNNKQVEGIMPDPCRAAIRLLLA